MVAQSGTWTIINAISSTGTPVPTPTPPGPFQVVQQVPASAEGLANSCLINNFGQGHALVLVSKTCSEYPNVPTITDSSGASYVGSTPANSSGGGTSGGLMFFGAFQHASGNISFSLSGGATDCYNLLECLEINGANGWDPTAGSGIAYGTVTTSQTGLVTPSLASASNPAMILGAAEVEGAYTLNSFAGDYGTGGGSPTLLPGVPSDTIGGTFAQMWTAYENVTTQTQHGFQVASVATQTPIPGTPTPGTPTPTPVAGCPSGDTCATPITEYGTLYGAGGGKYPTLRAGYHTWSCTIGTTDNSASLQSAIKLAETDGTDLQLRGTGQCTVLGTVDFKSSMAVQCQNINLELYTTEQASTEPNQFEFQNVSNSSLSNCTILGANTIDPSEYPGSSGLYGCGTPPNQTGCPPAEEVVLAARGESQ
jgi:hypothetical protein